VILQFPPKSGANASDERRPTAVMRKWPLHAHELLAHAARVHGSAQVVSCDSAGVASFTDYAALAERAAACAQALRQSGVQHGDAVLNLAFSSADQLAWLYGALSVGAVTHLLNPLFEPPHAAMLARACAPRVLLHDTVCAPLAKALSAALPQALVNRIEDAVTLPPASAGLSAQLFDEESPALVCYSSGTTGLPKAVQYTHRSLVLHAWGCAMPDAMGLRRSDRVMPLMQLFHALAWGSPFVCPMIGATLVLVPPSRDPALWLRCIEEQQVTVLGAVTAHWSALAAHMQALGVQPTRLRSTVIGGTRVPDRLARLISQQWGIEVRQAWGMTETSPLATMQVLEPGDQKLRHGKPVFGVQTSLGPALGAAAGLPLAELRVRGHWVATRPDSTTAQDEADGWLNTGDLAAVHANGEIEVVDRIEEAVLGTRQIISSALVEAQARTVPGLADAALLCWGPGCSVLAWTAAPRSNEVEVGGLLRAALIAGFDGWCPQELVCVQSLPYTPSAKVQKDRLKQTLATHPDVVALLVRN
jgi:3-(methylthio)propionyl---CoA ligase